MNLGDVVDVYFRGERQTGMAGACAGLGLLVLAFLLWRTEKETFGLWLSAGLAILGVICVGGGAFLAIKTPGQVADLHAQLGEDRAGMVAAELARMAKVNANWPRLKMMWGALALGAVVLLLAMPREWATALGLTLMFVATAGFFIDVFAERRAIVYTDGLGADGHEHVHDHDHDGMRGKHRAGSMQHRFEDAEKWVGHFESEERLAWQKPDEVVAALGLAKDATVADIGAGTGYFAVRFARAVPEGRVFAQDVEPDMLEYLRARAVKESLDNITIVAGAADDPKLPEPVDLAFICDVYHHIEDRPAYFAKLRKQLAPGGRLVIVDFKKNAPDDAPGPPAEHRIAADDVVAELGEAGFVLSELDAERLPYQYVLTFTAE